MTETPARPSKFTLPAYLVRRVSDGKYLRRSPEGGFLWVVSQSLATPSGSRLAALAFAVDRGIPEGDVRVFRVGPKP